MRSLFLLLLLSAWPQARPGRLEIVRPILHQFEDGPPIYADHKFIPGETVFFSFQVQGFQVSRKDDEQKVLLSYRLDAMDSQGALLAETETGKVDTSLTPQDKDWLPKIRRNVVIPPHALPGEYKIVASVKDEFSGQEAKREVSFAVQGRHIELSDTLVVRNFQFLRNGNDMTPFPAAAYRPGEAMWARFDITGFKIGEKNHLRVDYRISILGAGGKVLYTQPEPAVEENSPFYPERYVPGIVSLKIQPGTPAGQYTVLLTVRDDVGAQTTESPHVFQIQ